jgi:hypothetical protein
LSGRVLVLINRAVLCGSRSRFAKGLETSAAWLYPRSRSLWRCIGTGTTTSAESLLPLRLRVPPAAPQTTPRAARSARISAAGWPAQAPLSTPPGREHAQRHTSCPHRPGRAAWPPSCPTNAARGRPQTSHIVFGMANDERHSSLMGTRLARVSSRSQIRHPAGESALTSASPASAIQPRTPLRRATAATPDEIPSATQPELSSSSTFTERRNVRLGNLDFEHASEPAGRNVQISATQGESRVQPYRGSLQQPLLHLLLARDAVLGPRHSFQPLLLHLFLAVRANAIVIRLDTLQRRVNHVQDGAVRVGHPK